MLWSLGAIVLLALLLPATLYVPWVQNVVKDFACEYASRKTGMQIGVDRILLKFPIDLSVDGVLVIDEHKDTMVNAENLTARLAVRPLFDKVVSMDHARLSRGYYQMVSEDSSMLLKANVDQCLVSGVNVNLDKNEVLLLDGKLTGGNVRLSYLPYKVKAKEDTTQSAPWHIKATKLTLSNVRYTMDMMPIIDKLSVLVGNAELRDGDVDMKRHSVEVGSLAVDSLNCDYRYPSERVAARYSAAHPLPPDTLASASKDTATWQVKCKTLRLTNSDAVYALSGVKPRSKGLDMSYMALSGVNFEVDGLYNRGMEVDVPLKSLSAKERCGIELRSASGHFGMNEEQMRVDNFELSTMLSKMRLNAQVDNDFLAGKPTGHVRVETDSKIALQEVLKAFPEYRSMLKMVPMNHPVELRGSVSGNAKSLALRDVTAQMKRYAKVNVSGVVRNPMDAKRVAGDVRFDARFDNINFIKPTLMDKAMCRQVNLPPMTVKGDARFGGDTYSGNLDMRLATGRMVGNGRFSGKSMDYGVDLTFNHFPVKAILPLAGVGDITAHIKAHGHGFDFASPKTAIDGNVDLASVKYFGDTYQNVNAAVKLNGGNFAATLNSANSGCDLAVDCKGSLGKDRYVFDAAGKISDLDLQKFKLYDGVCRGRGNFEVSGDLNMKTQECDAALSLTDLKWQLDSDMLVTDKLDGAFASTDSTVTLDFNNEQTSLAFNSAFGPKELIKSFKSSADIALAQYGKRSLNIDTLQDALPPFELKLTVGPDGLVPRYLEKYDIDFRNIDCEIRNDSNIYIDGRVNSLSYGETAIDTITVHASEWNRCLRFDAHMGNRPGTWDEFASVDIKGGVIRSTLDMLVSQRNIRNETGYRVGVNATLTDSAVNARFFPKNPVIGYRKWSVNDSNYVSLNYKRRELLANLQLQTDSSKVSLLSNAVEADGKSDVQLKIDNLKVEEWLKFFPFAPEVSGSLNANMNVAYDGKNIWGDGTASLKNFIYERQRVGDIDLAANLSVDPSTSSTNLKADVDLDGSKVAFAYGSLNDSTKKNPFDVSLKLDRFPLAKVTPFIPGNMVWLRGYLNGDLAVTGSMSKPVYNGYVTPDSANIYIPRYGSQMKLTETRIPVDSGVVKFKDFGIVGINNRQVTVNGSVDISDMNNMVIKLGLAGSNVQFIGSTQQRYSDVFGKGFVDLTCSVDGRGSFMSVNADVALRSGSNLTYVLNEDVGSIGTGADRSMVTFVNMNDSTQKVDSLMTSANGYAMNIAANLNVQQGAVLNAYLSADGKDRVTINGSGRLRYTLDFAGKDNLVGRYTIESGSVRYSPPIISQKIFDFESGSSVVWSGDMMNPQLNVSATQHTKTTVTGSDNGSRLVDFLVTAKLGNSLNNVDLSFDLSTDNDISVENELQSMTAQQRSTAAINLLLYGTYSGVSGNGAPGLSSTGALYSFLQSQINSWAASTLKGVDLTFGINSYQDGSDGHSQNETSYSYRLSKSLFNDRFKIVVGGEYSTDATSEQNFSNNLVNDISFEYYLNKSGTKYLRLFRHTGYESVLEGEITEMGIAYVLKRKVSDLRHLFRYKSKERMLRDSIAAEEAKARREKEAKAESK